MNASCCPNVLPLLLRRRDGSLSARQVRALDAHLAGCPACRAYVAGLAATREAVARHAQVEEAAAALLTVPGPARRAVAQWLAEQQARPVAARTPAAPWFPLRTAPVAATAAFVLAGLAGGAFLLRPAASGKRHAVVPSRAGGNVVAAAAFPSFMAAARPHASALPAKQSTTVARSVATRSPRSWSPAAPSPRREGGNVPALDFARPAPPLALPVAAARADDLGYVNPDPARFAARWTLLAPTQADALEARLRASVQGGDGRFVSIPLPRVASAASGSFSLEAAAVASYRRAAQIVDARLQRKVTLALKNVAFSDLCDELSQKTDVKLSAARGVADDKITLFCTGRPLRDILRQISALFNFSWERSGEEGEYTYRLNQSLRAQLLEEELRNRDKNDAILALDKEMDALRKYLDLTPEQARALAKDATGDEKKRLDALAGPMWGAAQLYFGLSSDEQAALRNGDTLRWSADGGNGTQTLSPQLAQGILQSQAHNTRIQENPDGTVGVEVNDDPAKLAGRPGAPPAQVAGARALVQMRIKRNELGQYSIDAAGGVAVERSRPGENGKGENKSSISSLFGDDIATAVSPSVRDPKNADANARLKDDPDLSPRVSLRPRPSCPAAQEKAEKTEKPATPPPQHTDVNAADVLEAVHKATGRDVIGDSYARLYPAASATVESAPLFDALNRVSDALRLRWNRETDAGAKTSWLTFRSASFFNDRLKEVPNRLFVRLRERRAEQKGVLSLPDLLSAARLTDAQLDSGATAETAKKCYGLTEWDLVRADNLRGSWRFLAALPAALRSAALSETGLRFRDLPLARQQEFALLVFGPGEKSSRPGELADAALQNAPGRATQTKASRKTQAPTSMTCSTPPCASPSPRKRKRTASSSPTSTARARKADSAKP